MKKAFIILLLAVIGLAILYSIDYSPPEPEPDEDPDEAPEELVDPEETTDLSSSMTDFSFDIFFELTEDNENLFISPYSIHAALDMAYRGADEKTAEEMADVLGVTEMEMEQLMQDSLDLKQYLEHSSEENEVNIANSLFLKEGIPFLESYKSDGEEFFEAKIDSLPSTGKPINSWVEDKTEGKISKLIDPGPINPNLIAYLVNAIYFQGDWEEEFDEDQTTKRPFYGPEEELEVDMMENKENYKYKVGDNLQAVTMEYKDGDYLFHAFMPTDDRSLSEFYEEFDSKDFADMKPTSEEEIILRLPKFTLEDKMGLIEVLKSLGMEKAFDKGKADFSEMVDLESLGENVFISKVVHASFIEVDEKGTEAAAATAIGMEATSAKPSTPPTVEFNEPFLFLIEEPETETILFMGQLVNPES